MAQSIKIDDKKTIRSWAFFDWANSAYTLVVATAIFPPYFTANTDDVIDIFGIGIENTALYSFIVSFGYLIIAFISPLLSGIADYGGKRMLFLKIFTAIGSISCLAMFFFKGPSGVWLGSTLFLISTIGYAGSMVFYNAYLPLIASEKNVDKVSAQGYAFGYVGSVILLIMVLILVLFQEQFGITDSTLPARLGFIMVGLWWMGFAIIPFKHLPQDKAGPLEKGAIRKGYGELIKAFRKLIKQKMIKLFLASFFFYIAGVNTVIYVATIFAESELNFQSTEMIITVLIIQIVAIGGAYLFAYASKLMGNKNSIYIMLMIWIGICVAAYFTNSRLMFFTIAGFVGLVIGGIQSLSRSSYSKMIEGEEDVASFFSFYEFLRNLAIVSGTFIFGFVEAMTHNMRYSVLALSVLFVIGMVFMFFVKFNEAYLNPGIHNNPNQA